MKRFLDYIAPIVVIVLLLGCKKDTPKTTSNEIEPPQKVTVYTSDIKENNIKDSVFYYTKLFSLWQDDLPFKNLNDLNQPGLIRTRYTQYFQKAEDVLDWLVSLTPKNNETGEPIDRYSFLDREGVVSGEIQDAVATSFGMSVFYLQTSSSGNNADLFIRMVDKNSSAAEAGMERGDQIVSINSDTRIDYNSQKAASFNTLNGYLNSTTMRIRFKKATGEIVERDIVSKAFNFDPILSNQVILNNGKKIGYLAFSSFVAIEKSEDMGNGKTQRVKTPMYYSFENILNGFQGIEELVVDLRYNGGGSVLTAEYLADWFVPSSADKQLMYTSSMNSYFQREGWTRPGQGFGPVFFAKKGAINLKRIYFLVSKSTASASELLINVLKPYLQVYLIGTKAVTDNREVNEKTYGKPVGFWEWPIVEDKQNSGNNVSLYATSFKTYNKNGEGDYFNGIEPNTNVWEFRNFLTFGQEEESMLNAAITHIHNGYFTSLTLRSGAGVSRNMGMEEKMQQNSKGRSRMFKFSD